MNRRFVLAIVLAIPLSDALGQTGPDLDLRARLKAKVDAIRAIDTHDHLPPFDQIRGRVETPQGKGLTLFGILSNGYLPQLTSIPVREPGQAFDPWWAKAESALDNVRATGFYRYNQIALRDLHGVDLNSMTDDQARELDRKIFEKDRDEKWITEVITQRANIALMVNDPYWGRFDFAPYYPFEAQVLNVTTLLDGFHPSEYSGKPSDDPYLFARKQGLPVETLGDYLLVLDALFREAKSRGVVGLKSTRAYQRTLAFENVSRPRAEQAFGRKRSELSPEQVKDFEDFIMWQLVKRGARFGLPFQIHTGHGRLQGSNPLLLLDLIEANPDTKFVLFHGGYPWVGETGAILHRHSFHVWLDSVWLPNISPTMARRALHEWLEMMPSNRILWGADAHHAEGIYGATSMTREVVAEVLAEKVERGDLTEPQADRIARQILRENALEIFPTLKERAGADRR